MNFKILVSVVALLLVAGCANSPYLELQANRGATGAENSGLPPVTVVATPQGRLAEALAGVAATAAATGDYRTAARLYRRAHGIAPNRIAAALGLARSAQATGDNRGSIAAYQAVLRIDPDHLQAQEQIGRQLMTLGAPKEALPYLQAALDRKPDAGLYNELGIAHDLTGNHNAAQNDFRTALALAPGDLTLRTNLGRSLAFSGRYEDAIMTLQAVANRPTATKRHREALALAMAASGDVTAALRVTRADEDGANEADRRARYAMMGELVRAGEPGMRAELMAGTVQRDRHAGIIAQSRRNPRIAELEKSSGNSDLLTVLADIDARQNQEIPASAVIERGNIGETEQKSPEIAAEIGPKQLYQAENTAPTSLNLVPGDQETHGYLPLEVPEAAIADDEEYYEVVTNQVRPSKNPQTVYRVQLAAYHTTRRAEMGWRELVFKAPDVLDGIDHVTIRPTTAENTLLRLRTQAYLVKGEAQTLCDALKNNNLECLVVKTSQPHDNPSAEDILMAKEAWDKRHALADIAPAAGNPAPIAFVYRVQLAAYRLKSRAEKGWRQLFEAAPDILDGIDHIVMRPGTGDGALYRLRTQAFTEKRDARSLCDALKLNSLNCIVVKTGQPHVKPGSGDPVAASRVST